MRLYLGNAAVLEPQAPLDDGTEVPSNRRTDLDGNPTIVDVADDMALLDVLRNVEALWDRHSENLPVWVAAENPTIAQALSAQFAGVPVREYSEAEGHYRTIVGLAPAEKPVEAPQDAQVGLPAPVEDQNAQQTTTMADPATTEG